MWSVQVMTVRHARLLSRQISFWPKKRARLRKDALTQAEAKHRDELAAKVAHRCRSWCKLKYDPELKTCFSLENAIVTYGTRREQKLIRSFLYTYYWPREPSITNAWMCIHSPYLHVQTEKYSLSGDRFVAYQLEPRTQECKMVGVLIANKICPWTVDEIEEWAEKAHGCEPEQTRIAFHAHCLRECNLFKKYHVPYIYDLEVLATASEVTGLGLAELLLRVAISRAMELQHPLLQIQAKNVYVAKLCDRLGLTREWSMKYADFKDYRGRSRFFVRFPQNSITVYSRRCSNSDGGVPDFCTSPKLNHTYMNLITRPRVQAEKPRHYFMRDNMHYSAVEMKRERDAYRTGTCTCYKNIFQKTFLAECPPACYRDPMEKIRPEPRCPD